jgi:hypothetical protein
MKLLFMNLLLVYPVRLQYLPQHPIRHHPQPTYTLMCALSIDRGTPVLKERTETKCCWQRCVVYQRGLCAFISGIYPCFRFCLPKPGHTIDLTKRCISLPLGRVRSQSFGTEQGTTFSRSTWTCPQKLLDGCRSG